MRIIPQTQVPSLTLDLLHREQWSTDALASTPYTLLIIYRGYHCPICKSYLKEFQNLQNEFNNLSVQLVAASADSRERAERSRDEWALQKLAIGYGLSEKDMKDWGLYVSRGINEKEPEIFAEPALFLIQPDGHLFYAAYNSMPFGRPRPQDILDMVKFVEAEDYPARGEMRDFLLTKIH
ncbi:MAG TPA: redoxin domain-containing protein [Phycisphaerales bacterium]|nr:redoxin domain-containing protein [Phycisphaerales bacterium]